MNYFIITPNGINMSSAQLGCQGEKNHIAVNSPELFKRALNGEVVLIASQLTDVSERACTGEAQSTQYLMYFAAPVRNDDGDVIAVLLQGLDNQKDLSDILRHGRIGVSGESYAFDRNGLMLSERQSAGGPLNRRQAELAIDSRRRHSDSVCYPGHRTVTQ